MYTSSMASSHVLDTLPLCTRRAFSLHVVKALKECKMFVASSVAQLLFSVKSDVQAVHAHLYTVVPA